MQLSGFSLKKIVKIDGSLMEGGGSILRTAVPLSAILKQPIEIYNIRANRSTPGLRNQHLHVIKAIAEIANAKTMGVSKGSEKISFFPSNLQGGDFNIDVGTAGSLSLLLQAIIPVAAFAPEETNLKLRGGTDVKWSPPIDYMSKVYLPMLEKIGLSAIICIGRRGHYPKGGGLVSCQVDTIDHLEPIRFKYDESITIESIEGKAHAVQLPRHISERMIDTATSYLVKKGYTVGKIEDESYEKRYDPHIAPGAGITLWAKTNVGTIIAGDALGERGIPAETVGRKAAQNLDNQLQTGHPVDYHLTDQLILWMALQKKEAIIDTTKITSHALTNIEIVKQLVEAYFTVSGEKGQPGIIKYKPVE
jgi:RNA 3'-phosphate cyclase